MKERLEYFTNKRKVEVIMEFEDLLDSKNKPFIMNNNVVFPLK